MTLRKIATVWLLVSLATAANAKSGATVFKEVVVDGIESTLTLEQFIPIKSSWAGREVITGYQALVDVNNTSAIDTLLFSANAEISANWFAASFMADVYVNCAGIPIGYDLAQGQRVNRHPVPARISIKELRHGVGGCRQLHLEIRKRGSLSRQFFTRFEKIRFNFRLESIREAK